MKRVLSVFLSLVMVVLCVPAFYAATAVASYADALPSAVDLSTTSYLPPIGNQGAIGCCVSMAATHMQLTNAYARYLGWNPSAGSASYIFAPRFTYNLGGASTAQVYHILQEQGAPTQSVTLKNGSTYSMSYSGGVTGYASYNDLARNWGAYDGVWDAAQTYRISNFDQVWADAACGFNFKSTSGQALIRRIKENINAGNVVVTGGYPNVWTNETPVTISNKGTYGKKNEVAVAYSTGTPNGGHQVSIVGYDDNITCVKNGVTLTGAFKIANSWGDWQNSGYIWVMYDALNGTGQSAYSALNVSNRIWTFDQFVFLDYRTDLKYGTPELMAKVTVSSADRDNFAITLKRMDIATGETASYLPLMFSEHSRDAYNEGYNFAGRISNTPVDGVITLNFDHFTDDLPQGKTVDDYLWGVEVSYVSTDSGKTPTVKKVELLRNGVSVFSKTGLNDGISSGVSKSYMLDQRLAVSFDLPKGVTLTPANGSSFVSPAGTTVSFNATVANGYKVSNNLNIYHNGVRLVPVNGVYSFQMANGYSLEHNRIKVDGVVPNQVAGIEVGLYGTGFEFHSNEHYWMLLQISKSNIDPAAVDTQAIDSGKYDYTIRCKVGDIYYDFTPQSYYDFGSELLFRINVADQGWFPTNGQSYSLVVELCYHGVPVYGDYYVSITCRVAPVSDIMTEHTHSFTGETVVVSTSTCTQAGAGYVRCSHAGCKALQPVALPIDSGAHSYSNDLVVSKPATATEPGEYSCVCTRCGATAFAGYFDAPLCDATGDSAVTVADISLVLDILAEKTPATSAACSLDFNHDGIFSVKDLTYILFFVENI